MIVRGKGLVNNLINKLPVELHIPGYRYCGPGTKLEKRLARGDSGVNPLDSACREHDIKYSKNKSDIEARNMADRELAEKAWERLHSRDSSIGEKAAAMLINNIMKVKSKLGMGIKKNDKGIAFRKIVKVAKDSMVKSTDAKKVISSALKAARKAVKKSGGRSKVRKVRVLPIPQKVGGVLPLIPIFAGLSALGAVTGGIAGVTKAVNDASAARKQLEEAKRHNLAMEKVSLGNGLYLKPYKTGNGLRLYNENLDGKKKTSM